MISINSKTITLIASIILFFILLEYLPVEAPINKALALLTLIAILWVTQAIPITITALLIPILASTLGLLTVNAALVSFANPVIFLFLGGFALAAALHKHGLDHMLAQKIVALCKGNFLSGCILLFAVTAFISMWISNTAATAMMLPLALGMLSDIEFKHHRKTYVFVLLGTAYAANIGGLATVLGSPPNAIAVGILNITFMDWFKVGLPTAIILFCLLIVLLLIILRPNREHSLKIIPVKIKFDRSKIILAIIFVVAVGCWVFGKPLSALVGGGIESDFDSLVALSVVVLLCVTGVVKWKDIEAHTAWGVLLLFGGGITLSVILDQTGTITYFVALMSAGLFGVHTWLIILLVITFVVFFTNIASNTATGALMIPLFMVFAQAIGFPSESMAIAVALSATCAFMLPVATPPVIIHQNKLERGIAL